MMGIYHGKPQPASFPVSNSSCSHKNIMHIPEGWLLVRQYHALLARSGSMPPIKSPYRYNHWPPLCFQQLPVSEIPGRITRLKCSRSSPDHEPSQALYGNCFSKFPEPFFPRSFWKPQITSHPPVDSLRHIFTGISLIYFFRQLSH